ncbi:MAG: hypothetical protein ABIJ40_12310 [Bacteroidota bacterium]
MANDFKNYNKVADPTVRKHYFDFSGGMNNTDPEHLIQDNEVVEARNCLIEGTSIVKRKGSQQIAESLGGITRGLGRYTQYSGVEYLICSQDDKFYYLNGEIEGDGTWTRIYSIENDNSCVRFKNYLGKIFVTNGKTGGGSSGNNIQSWDGDSAVSALSVTPDHTTETFTAAAHGLEDDDLVRFSGTTVPTGLSFSTTYYVINKAADTFQVSLTSGGAAAAFTANGVAVTVTEYMHVYSDLPVASATSSDYPYYLESFKGRLIMVATKNHPYRIYYTNEGATTIETNNYFDLDVPITGVKTFKDHLYIFTEREIYRVDGFIFNGVGSEPERVNDYDLDLGAVSDKTVQAVDNIMYFLNRSDIYAFDGISKPARIATPRIKNLFKQLNQNYFSTTDGYEAVAVSHNHKYYLYVEDYVYFNDENKKILIFDTENKAWTYYNEMSGNTSITSMVTFPDANKEERLIADVEYEPAIMEVAYSNITGENIIVNGSFEIDDGLDSIPDDWVEEVSGAGGTVGGVDQQGINSRLGNYSIRVYKTAGTSYVRAAQDINVGANTGTYEYRFYIQSDNQNNADIYVRFIQTGGDETVYKTIQVGDKDNSQGKYYYGTVDIDDAAFTIELTVDNNTSVTAYFDDIRLCKVTQSFEPINFNVKTKTNFLGNPQRQKKFKSTFVSAKSSTEFNLDDEDYNLNVGYSQGFSTTPATTTVGMNNSNGFVEEVINNKIKARHIQYTFSNSNNMEPIELYGYTIDAIPLDKYK